MTTSKPHLDLTAEDVMARDVVTVPQEMSLRDAAHVLRRAGVGGAFVVDLHGRCVGGISAFDFLRWAEGEVPNGRHRPCPYLVRGHPANGYGGWICVLAEGGCPFQATQPTTAGRHISVCLHAPPTSLDWPELGERLPTDSVQRYMTSEVVTAGRGTRLPELARLMIDAHLHRILITDEDGRPVGVVSSTCLLEALAAAGAEPRRKEVVSCL